MNIEWKTMSLEDKDIVMPYYEYEQSNCCEVSFANNILYQIFPMCQQKSLRKTATADMSTPHKDAF